MLYPHLGTALYEGGGETGENPDVSEEDAKGVWHTPVRAKVEGTVSSLEKRRLRWGIIAGFKYLDGCYKEEGKQLFSLAAERRTQGSGFELLQNRFNRKSQEKTSAQ